MGSRCPRMECSGQACTPLATSRRPRSPLHSTKRSGVLAWSLCWVLADARHIMFWVVLNLIDLVLNPNCHFGRDHGINPSFSKRLQRERQCSKGLLEALSLAGRMRTVQDWRREGHWKAGMCPESAGRSRLRDHWRRGGVSPCDRN